MADPNAGGGEKCRKIAKCTSMSGFIKKEIQVVGTLVLTYVKLG